MIRKGFNQKMKISNQKINEFTKKMNGNHNTNGRFWNGVKKKMKRLHKKMKWFNNKMKGMHKNMKGCLIRKWIAFIRHGKEQIQSENGKL